jgi:hypothetical protein
MIAEINSDRELRRRWRQQMSDHCDARHVAARRGFAALAFLDNANTPSPYVDIKDFFVLVLFEDECSSNGRTPLRLGGYSVTRISDGVQWGGAENARLDKNLTLAPQHGARGQRIDRGKRDLIAAALRLDRRLTLAARYPAAPWRELRLPRLWAGFRASHAGALRGEGPEFEQACQSQTARPVEIFRSAARQIDGLVAYPLDWVNGQGTSAVAVFAELTLGVRRQVCRIGELPGGLIGFQGASAFDFYNSRFGRQPRKHRPSHCNRVISASPQNGAVERQILRIESFVA